MARPPVRGLLAVLAVLTVAGGCTAPVSAKGPADTARPVAAPSPTDHPVVAKTETPPVAAPVPPPPPPPPVTGAWLWPFTHLFNADYVDVHSIGQHFGLKASWVVSGRVMQLADARGRVRLRFEERNRAFFLEGVRVFLGETTAFSQSSLWVGKADVIKTIVPLLQPADHAGQLPAPPKLIVLDAGHGGNDSGTQNAALHLDEKDMTLDVVLRLKKVLEARGYRVLLTRADDRRVELEQRPEIAGRARADLLLSVHFNNAEASVAGTEVYSLTPQFQTSTQPEKDKQMVPALFPGNRQDYANTLLGYQLQRRLLADLRTSDRGAKRARWVVLRFAECPAALIEVAFLSNAAEARRVATPEYRQQIAQAIAGGVDDYAAALAAVHPPPPVPVETHAAPPATAPPPPTSH
jgi:N-acetylmuramoyl-L-alanine amidase